MEERGSGGEGVEERGGSGREGREWWGGSGGAGHSLPFARARSSLLFVLAGSLSLFAHAGASSLFAHAGPLSPFAHAGVGTLLVCRLLCSSCVHGWLADCLWVVVIVAAFVSPLSIVIMACIVDASWCHVVGNAPISGNTIG